MTVASDMLVLREERSGVCTLTLNRPDKLNAVNPPLFKELRAHLDDLVTNGAELGVIVLRGAGKSFCAGHDLGEVGAMDLAWLRHESRTLEIFSQLPQIVLAAVHGNCLTGGLELALAADIIIASESARFADTHGTWGLVPAWGMSQRLPRRVGAAKALELMVTCRRVDGREAERLGLANICVPDDQLDATVTRFASAILASSRHSNTVNKRLVHDTDGLPLQQGMAHELFRSPGSKKRDPTPVA
ncbi:MAG: enoyl-CoA hydratase/isomerase family protein [Sulfuricaulis sp.]|nr:enoyl-CoA hydratase/isomerase family protein [Sulfuricaulis sp.]